jgi:hypothetical protein
VTIPFSTAFFSPRLLFLTRALKIIGYSPDEFMGKQVSAFGNGGLSGKRHNRADAQRAPFCAADELGF